MTVDIRDLPARFAELVTAASREEIIITDGTVARARLLPLPAGKPRTPGLHPGAIQTTKDFDAPLPDNLWTGNE